MSAGLRAAYIAMSPTEFAEAVIQLTEAEWISIAQTRYRGLAKVGKPNQSFSDEAAAAVYYFHKQGRW